MGRSPPANLRRQIAASIDAPVALLPLIPDLFAGLSSFGSSPRRVVNWLRDAGIGRRSRVLDLGCGKGAVSVSLARRLGSRVEGVDAFPPFIDAARDAAREARVSERCEFHADDLRAFARRASRAAASKFDAVVVLNVLPAERALPLALSLVKPGGVVVVDDAVALESARGAGVRTAAEIRAMIHRLGARLEREHVMTPVEYGRLSASLQRPIVAAARRVVREQPRRAGQITLFLAHQREADDVLSRGPLRGAIWLVRRGRAGRVPAA